MKLQEALLLVLLCGLAGVMYAEPEPLEINPIDPQSTMRFKPPRKNDAIYSLRLTTPWQDGGELYMNIPHHLEYDKMQGILRNTDAQLYRTFSWVIADDARQAVLDVESITYPGVYVQAEARITGADQAEIVFTIINDSDTDIHWVRSMLCNQYRELSGFPDFIHQESGNRQKTFVSLNNQIISVYDLLQQDQKGDPGILQLLIRGSAMNELDIHSATVPDEAIVYAQSRTDDAFAAVGWTPGASVMFNLGIICMHADAYFGAIPSGGHRSALGTIVFGHGPLSVVRDRLRRYGVGQPDTKVKELPIKPYRTTTPVRAVRTHLRGILTLNQELVRDTSSPEMIRQIAASGGWEMYLKTEQKHLLQKLGDDFGFNQVIITSRIENKAKATAIATINGLLIMEGWLPIIKTNDGWTVDRKLSVPAE